MMMEERYINRYIFGKIGGKMNVCFYYYYGRLDYYGSVEFLRFWAWM